MTDKKRTAEDIKAAMRDTPAQDLPPLQAELDEAEAAEKPKAPPAKDKDKG